MVTQSAPTAQRGFCFENSKQKSIKFNTIYFLDYMEAKICQCVDIGLEVQKFFSQFLYKNKMLPNSDGKHEGVVSVNYGVPCISPSTLNNNTATPPVWVACCIVIHVNKPQLLVNT